VCNLLELLTNVSLAAKVKETSWSLRCKTSGISKVKSN